MVPLKVLIIEDSNDDVELLTLELESSNFDLSFDRVQTAQEFSAALDADTWDVVLSDYSLPGFSATAALEILKASGKDIPFIIVSGTIGEEAAVIAMRAGAADYFSKNNVVRLIPAIERELRDAQERHRRRVAETDLQRKIQFDRLLQEVAVYANTEDTVPNLLQFVIERVCGYTGIPLGRVFMPDPARPEAFISTDLWYANDQDHLNRFREVSETLRFTSGVGMIGEVMETHAPAWLSNQSSQYSRRAFLDDLDLNGGVAYPVLADGTLAAVLEFYTSEPLINDEAIREIIPQIIHQVSHVIERNQHITALRQSEERFRKLFQALPIPVIISDRQDNTVLYANDVYVSFLGQTLSDFIGRPAPDFYFESAETPSLLEHLSRRDRLDGFELQVRQPDGSERWLLVSCEEADFDGQTALITGFQDITERREIEEKERQQRAQAEALRDAAALLLNTTLDLRSILDKILAQIALVIPHDAACVMLVDQDDPATVYAAHKKGYSRRYPDEIQHLRLHIEEHEYLRRMYASAKPHIINDTRTESAWHEDLPQSWMRASMGAPLRIREEISGFLFLDSTLAGSFTDEQANILQAFADLASAALQNARFYDELNQYAATLEERVNERTAQLNDEKERVEAILNNSSDATVLGSFDGVIQQVNPAFHRLFGYQHDHIEGRSLLSLADSSEIPTMIEALSETVNQRSFSRIEIVATRSDGSAFDADVALAAIVQQEKIQGIVCGIRDITERKQAEREMRTALTRARELNELKSRFTSMVSHEFRTPLAVISSSAGILRQYADRMDEPRRQSHLDQIQAQIDHLVYLLNNVLSLSRAESLEIQFSAGPLNLGTLCQELVSEMQQTTENHELMLNVTVNCPEIMADTQLMRQAINNLLSNAIKYSPDGGRIQVDVQCSGDELALRVRDCGIGIPEDDIKHLFDAFHRAPNVGTISGTGLGLAIVKHAVEAHGGSIDVQSKVGKGTTFMLRMPLEQEASV